MTVKEMSEKSSGSPKASSRSSTLVGDSDPEKLKYLEGSESNFSHLGKQPSKFGRLFACRSWRKRSPAAIPEEGRASIGKRLREYFTYTPTTTTTTGYGVPSPTGLNKYQRMRDRMHNSGVNFAGCFAFFVLFFLWAGVNAGLAVWQYFYVQVEVRPYNHRKIVNNGHAHDAFEVLLFLIGFVMFIPNGAAAFGLGYVFVALGNVFNLANWGKRTTNGPGCGVWSVVKGLIGFLLIVVLFSTWLGVGLFIAAGQFVGPFVTVPLTWKYAFKDSCSGFNTRIYLDSNAYRPAQSVLFKEYPTGLHYSFQMQPNPLESNNFYNVFTLDPGFIPGSNTFVPTFDSVHYNFTSATWSTFLGNVSQDSGSFVLGNTLVIPDLNLTANTADFGSSQTYEPFLKVYSTTNDANVLAQKRSWEDSTDVVMRTAKFNSGDLLQVCARYAGDPVPGLGPKTPVPIGLLILLRDRHPIDNPNDNNNNDQ